MWLGRGCQQNVIRTLCKLMIALGYLQADNERWCQRLQQAEYDELVAQQKCDKQSWEYLEYLQLDLTEAAAYHDLALATTSHTESSEYSQTMAKLIRTAIR